MKKYYLIYGLLLCLFACKDTNQQTAQKHETSNNIYQSLQVSAPDDLQITWEHLTNFTGDTPACRSQFTLKNTGAQTLGNTGWAIYYNQTNRVVKSVVGDVLVEQISGDFYRITPKPSFNLAAHSEIQFTLDLSAWLTKMVDAPLGLYIVYSDETGKEIAKEHLNNYTMKPFTKPEQINRHKGDKHPLDTPEQRYVDNAYLSQLPKEKLLPLIPSPVSWKYGEGNFTLNATTSIHFDAKAEKEAKLLKYFLYELGTSVSMIENGKGGYNTIALRIEPLTISGKKKEAYRLIITKRGVEIVGNDMAGVFYGIQSLLALLPHETYQNPETVSFPSIEIEDAPRFPYRGMHLDIARNFNDAKAVKKLMDAMAAYKLNKLHLHLTEDEAWRIEIVSLPELTEISSKRGHTLASKNHLHPSYGSGFDSDDASSNGNGFLSQNDFIDILRYATDRHIEVIPEINMPGHARGAIKAMEARYARLMAAGQETEAAKYLLSDIADSSAYKSVQDYKDNVVCVCQESVYTFYETIVNELIALYKQADAPLSTIHTGGDEVPKGVWEKSPVCAELFANNPTLNSTADLPTYFLKRINQILQSKGLVTAGWEEIAMKKVGDSGQWIPHPDFKNSNMLPYVWQNLWGNQDLGNRLANAGYPVVLCSVTNLYFDLAYSKSPEEPGLYWGGYINTRKAYEIMPFDLLKSTYTDAMNNRYDDTTDYKDMERLKRESYPNIKGLQGQLWSETIKGADMLEYYYLPKMLGLAERAWSPQADWEKIADYTARTNALNETWNVFANTLAHKDLPQLAHRFGGYNYRIPSPGAVIKNGILKANVAFPHLAIHYTTDGSEPTLNAPIYTIPVTIGNSVKLRAFDASGKGSRTVLMVND